MSLINYDNLFWFILYYIIQTLLKEINFNGILIDQLEYALLVEIDSYNENVFVGIKDKGFNKSSLFDEFV